MSQEVLIDAFMSRAELWEPGIHSNKEDVSAGSDGGGGGSGRRRGRSMGQICPRQVWIADVSTMGDLLAAQLHAGSYHCDRCEIERCGVTREPRTREI